MRQTNFSILKAIAIICVVLSHAGISGWLSHFVFIFHVPIFFICAGYFFSTKYLNDERTFLIHRVKGLYFPFVRWSLLFLLLHNVFFHLGILSEQFGNAAGGVTHPYNWQQFSQHVWSILVNMSGYDQFLGGAFWFFRALLLASIGFLLLFKLLRRSPHFQQDKQAGWALLLIPILLICWKISNGLQLTGIAQGGYRELMGMTFMAGGFLLRQYNLTERLTWRIAVPSLALLLLASFFFPSSMVWNPKFADFAALPLPAFAAFVALLYAATWIDRGEHFFKRVLIYIGDHTLYIFAFHLIAFKVVSAIKVAYLGLPWEAVGSHPVVHEAAGNALWILLYVIVGVGLPLLWLEGYRRLTPKIQINLTQEQILNYLILAAKLTFRFLCRLTVAIYRSVINFFKSIWQGIKDIIAASSTQDE